MTGNQRTFLPIPTTLVKQNGQQRPMTSKAAKKAYQQANRGPKVSRAEQHRRDKAELEQQKREYEKEKAAERAKAARDKKAAKAAAEKDVRKKQGLPEPSRFVRASQPTISRFVRTDSTKKRNWQQMKTVAEDSDKTMSDVERDDEAPPAKRQAVYEGSDDEFGDFPSMSQPGLLDQIDSSILSAKDGISGPNPATKKRLSSQPRRREASPEVPVMKDVDEHSMLNTQAIEELATTQLLSDLAEVVAKSDSLEPPDVQPSKPEKPAYKVTLKVPSSPRRSGRVADRSEKAPNILNMPKPSTIPVVEIPYKSPEELQSSPRDARLSSQAPVSKLQARSINMPPPRLPNKATMATKPISTPQRPSFPSRNPTRQHLRPLPNLPPFSTQAFLENHLDDFFPSPTQAVRELLDDIDDIDDIPSNTQVTRELSPPKPKRQSFENMFSTQDMILSPEDLIEIISPHRSPPGPLVEANSKPPNRREHTPRGRDISPDTSLGIPEDRFTAQGMVISQEEVVKMVSPRRSPPKPPVEAELKPLNGQRQMVKAREMSPEMGSTQIPEDWFTKQDMVISQEEPAHRDAPTPESLNRRNIPQAGRDISPEKGVKGIPDNMFSTQDLILSPEDLVEICSSPIRVPSPIPRQEARSASPKNQVPLPRPPHRKKQRFFQEKEEDLYHAAIHESKTTSAHGKTKSINDTRSNGRNQSDSTDYGEFDFDLPGLFKEKEDEELEAAIRESKITAEAEAKRLAMAGMPGLDLIQSHSTDYGEFDLPRLFDKNYEETSNTRTEPEIQVPQQPEELPANNAKPKPRRFFEEKYEDQVHAAIHESKMMAEMKLPPRQGNGQFPPRQGVSMGTDKPKRTFKRVVSTATDYGDDDFTGCSQELLDLC